MFLLLLLLRSLFHDMTTLSNTCVISQLSSF